MWVILCRSARRRCRHRGRFLVRQRHARPAPTSTPLSVRGAGLDRKKVFRLYEVRENTLRERKVECFRVLARRSWTLTVCVQVEPVRASVQASEVEEESFVSSGSSEIDDVEDSTDIDVV